MSKHFYAVIMAGGGGTRLWPLSRQKRPKQMLRLFDERTLFQTSVERLQGLFPPDHIYVVTVRDQADELHKQTPEIPDENFLIEPMPRGTASVVGLAAVALQQRDPHAVMAVLTADHFIEDEARFRQYLNTALKVAQDGFLVTLGIQPTSPSTGFGYIQRGELLGHYDDLSAFRVLRFTEKPDEQRAEQMLSSGEHSWNSGMFIWRVDRIMEEFEWQMPELVKVLEKIAGDWNTAQQETTLLDLWPQIQPETIDYGIMENADQVAVIPASGLGWNDVGSWDSLFDVLPSDESGNIIMGGAHIGLDTHQSLVYMQEDRRLIVTIGVEDLVLVDTGDVLLVCHKDQAQRVRQVVKKLEEKGQDYV
jgi:mannose-1-phosphate guanylyltransferase